VPVNCTAHPVTHDLARFARLGVGRITYGPLLQAALTGHDRPMARLTRTSRVGDGSSRFAGQTG